MSPVGTGSSVDDIRNGSTISFQSKAANDSNLYTGNVVGIVSIAIASNFNDVVTYHSNVKANDPTIADVSSLNYFIIERNDNKGTLAFAKEWIEDGSLVILSTTNVGTFVVQGVLDLDAAQDIIDAIRVAGYHSRLVSIA